MEPRQVLSAAREMKEAAEAAAKVTSEALNVKECRQTNSATTAPDLTYLNKLVEYLEQVSRVPSYIPAANIWRADFEVLTAQLDILLTLETCLPHAGEKKKARNVATEALHAYHQLTTAIATFDVLALLRQKQSGKSKMLKSRHLFRNSSLLFDAC